MTFGYQPGKGHKPALDNKSKLHVAMDTSIIHLPASPEQYLLSCSWIVLIDEDKKKILIKAIAFKSIFGCAKYYSCGIAVLSLDSSGEGCDWNTDQV